MRCLLLLAACIIQWCTVSAEECPYPCTCHVNSDEARSVTVDCRNQDLFEIPLGVPPTATHLSVTATAALYALICAIYSM